MSINVQPLLYLPWISWISSKANQTLIVSLAILLNLWMTPFLSKNLVHLMALLHSSLNIQYWLVICNIPDWDISKINKFFVFESNIHNFINTKIPLKIVWFFLPQIFRFALLISSSEIYPLFKLIVKLRRSNIAYIWLDIFVTLDTIILLMPYLTKLLQLD